MLSVEEALARVLAPLAATSNETVALSEAWGRVLATPVMARLTQPPADVSAMDGYALRAADAPVGARLRIAGHAPAGHPYAGAVGEGEAVRLFTGSVMPAGADTVLLQEDAAAAGTIVIVNAAPKPGQHIRPRGQDFAAGDTVLTPGIRLEARQIGLAAAANHPWLTVHRRPTVAILATGDEISMPGEPVGPGGIVSSNSHMLAAMVRAAGAVPLLLPVARDTPDAIAEAADSAGGADLLVTTGGASVGDHDVVQAGLAQRGFALDFWKIAMRPGKPMISGRIGAMPVLGLPGNPVSAFVCATLFMVPALARLSGLADAPHPRDSARLGTALRENDHRADHLRATLTVAEDGVLTATPFPRQDSGMLSILARADCLILRAPHAPAEAESATVPIIRLDSF
jgi:molybdopterin molybdotransferase